MEASSNILANIEAPLRVKKSKQGSSAFITIPYFVVDAYGMKEGDLIGVQVVKIVKAPERKK